MTQNPWIKVFHRVWKSLWINGYVLGIKRKKSYPTRENFPFERDVEKQVKFPPKGWRCLLKTP